MSIIINVYNGEATLRETIDSVLAQTFADWELIIWDDASTDASIQVVAAFDEPRIRLHSVEQNRGLGASRVAALEHATGDWLAFVDQDDIWTPDKLELQLAQADAHPDVGFIYGRAIKFYPDGRRMDYDHRHEYGRLPEGDIFERLFVDSCFIAISTVLFGRRALEGIPALPSYIAACPDYYFYLAIAKKHSVAAIQRAVCYYRIHAANMTHSHGQRMQQEILRLIDDWGGSLPPELAAQRRRVHSTVLAVHQMQSPRNFAEGLRTLLTRGGLAYLFSRPFARAYRSVRRRFMTPYWQQLTAAGAVSIPGPL